MRALLFLLIVLTVTLQGRLWFGDGGLHETKVLHAAIADAETNNAELRARNQALIAEVEDLRSGGEAIEERARFELGLVAENETFYRVIEREDESLKL